MKLLNYNEKAVFDKLFNRDGHVLDFTNKSFSNFFKEYKVDIENNKYLSYCTDNLNSNSKMNRLRAFWSLEEVTLVIKVIYGLLEYAKFNKIELDKTYLENAKNILLKYENSSSTNSTTEDDFLKIKFNDIAIQKLNLDSTLEKVINQRINEIQFGLNTNMPLSVIFLCGSSLEGILLNLATMYPQKFNESKCAPKNKDNNVKQLHDWTLSNLIDACYELNFIKLDVKNFSHSIREFRNYIHPRQQAIQNFNPDKHTAIICWQVLQAAIADLNGTR
ncbi:MAG: hypothetical protein EKK64_04080 [Neisseriaceae bacterium]|nr:MAG: hypothetical protein EKK64_04080 [Neisseriaceae bacterium]